MKGRTLLGDIVQSIVVIIITVFMVCGWLAGCDSPMRVRGDIELLDMTVAIPEIHDVVAELSVCVGATVEWEHIRWYRAESVWNSEGQEIVGIWFSSHVIYLNQYLWTGSREYLLWVVKHELLHDYLNGDGHSSPLWVSCDLDY